MRSITSAFPGCQQGRDEPTEAIGFYKLRTGGPPESTAPRHFSFSSQAGGSELRPPGPNYLESIAKTSLKAISPLLESAEKNVIKVVETAPESQNFEPEGEEALEDEERSLFESDREIRGPLKCGAWATFGECENGHSFAKAVDCGREWCSKCKNSSHRRRMGRWISKAQKIGMMGYLVITFPIEKRPRSKEELRRFGVLITEALKRRSINRGLRRWHFFGEKSRVWNPHLNILVDEGYLNEERLNSIKEIVCELIGAEKVVVNYQYSQNVRKKLHWIKYITRPTFVNRAWDEVMAEELYNFRNTVNWGTWADEDKWTLPKSEKKLGYIAKLEKNICPVCGSGVHWHGVKPIERALELGYDQIWEKAWQFKAPPEQVLLFNLFKAFNRSVLENNRSGALGGRGVVVSLRQNEKQG